MTSSCKIALVAMESRCGKTNENFKRVSAYMEDAGRKGANIAVFPEAALTGYCLRHACETALAVAHPMIDELRRTAQSCGVTALVGMAERDGDCLYMTQLVCGSDGMLKAYRKTHLGSREKNFFSAGDTLSVFGADPSFGIAICYDMHFPEAAAAMRSRGAEIIVVPHASPVKAGSRSEVWARYIPARAYDNRVYVACCNACGSNGCGTQFSGGTAIYAPDGSVAAADFSGKENMLVSTIEPVSFEGAANFPAHRRGELYY